MVGCHTAELDCPDHATLNSAQSAVKAPRQTHAPNSMTDLGALGVGNINGCTQYSVPSSANSVAKTIQAAESHLLWASQSITFNGYMSQFQLALHTIAKL